MTKGRFALVAVLASICAGALAPAAGAATIEPDITTDEFDLSPNADCSLREAVESADADADTGGCEAIGAYGTTDTISLGTATYTLTLPGNDDDDNETGDLDVLGGPGENLNFQGDSPGATINQSGTFDRILDVPVGGPSVALINVTVSGGNLQQGTPTNLFGGGIRFISGGSDAHFSNG